MAYVNFKQLIELEEKINFDKPISWRSAGHSHVGKVRELNEDAFYNSTEKGLWAVADGMGGFARGDYASGVVAEAFVHFNPLDSLSENIRDLELRLKGAHELCRTTFPGEKVGSTVVSLLSYGDHCIFLWAGDSRVYRLRGEHFTQLTVDHTLAQERYARGDLSAKQALTHPSAHVLTRAVGVHQTLYLDLEYEIVKPGDRYLLCSDGLYNDLPREDIHEILKQGSIEEAVENLVNAAVDKRGSDNTSAIIVEAII